MNLRYEVLLGPAAIRVFRRLSARDRAELADALRNELAGGPNQDKEYTFHLDSNARSHDSHDGSPGAPGGRAYTATPLSFSGYTAVHRPLDAEEIGYIGQLQELVSAHGPCFFVLDILPAEAGISRRPRLP